MGGAKKNEVQSADRERLSHSSVSVVLANGSLQ